MFSPGWVFSKKDFEKTTHLAEKITQAQVI